MGTNSYYKYTKFIINVDKNRWLNGYYDFNTYQQVEGDGPNFLLWYLGNTTLTPWNNGDLYSTNSNYKYTVFITNVDKNRWLNGYYDFNTYQQVEGDGPNFLLWYLGNTTLTPYISPSTDPTPQLRTLPVPEDLSNSIIFSTNFYSRTDLSNGIGSVPPNLFDSSGNTDISFTTAREFWLNEISNNTFSDPSNEGITIITIQFTSNYSSNHPKPGAHMLEFYNWDLSANSDYSLDLNNNSRIFKAYENTKLISDMSFIVGIPNINHDISLQKIPVAIVEGPSSENTFTDMCDNNFNNYMIVLGQPILVNITELYSYNLRNLRSDNLYNWRSLGQNKSSSNHIWINNDNYYSDDISNNELNRPIILIPDVSYTIHNSSNIDVSFNNLDISANQSLSHTVSHITFVQ